MLAEEVGAKQGEGFLVKMAVITSRITLKMICCHIEDFLQLFAQILHCGKKYQKFPPHITDRVDHNTPVTENFGIKFSTSISECLAMYLGIFRNSFLILNVFSF
jgi:hypothetical protein